QQPRLRRVLSRFKRNELPGVVQWLVGNEETPVRGTKRDIVSSTLDAFSENKVSEHAITELELKYILTHPDSLQWKGYSLTYANALVPSMVDTDPQMFCKRFQVYLSNLDYDIADTLSTPYHWLALHIGGQWPCGFLHLLHGALPPHSLRHTGRSQETTPHYNPRRTYHSV
ncbi:hypothetical protein GBAR_LOCUS19601, partial [Geodia barretti]